MTPDKPFSTAHAEIDLRLAVLRAVIPAGKPLTQYEIADACGCSRSLIYFTEKRALKKIRHRMRRVFGISLGELVNTRGMDL